MSYEIKAVYQDEAGNHFSAPVVRADSGWRLMTANGQRQIDFFIPEKDAAGGMLTFTDYAIRTKDNLRGCDFIQKVNAIRSLLPWPVKPANPPSVQTEPADSPIHVEPRQPGQNSFGALQKAGARMAAQYRANRERERQQAQETLGRPEARLINNQLAAQMRPKRNTGE